MIRRERSCSGGGLRAPGRAGRAQLLPRERRLLVSIANIGEAAADASRTSVTFAGGTAASRATPALAAGAEATLEPIPLPASGEGTFTFTIEADAREEIAESDELNNRAQGACTIIN